MATATSPVPVPEALTVVADVLAADARLHATMECLGFWPTVYYPSLIAVDGRRGDAVQYTRLFNGALDGSLECLASIDWPAAHVVIERTKELYGSCSV